jgi:hypothetical protein
LAQWSCLQTHGDRKHCLRSTNLARLIRPGVFFAIVNRTRPLGFAPTGFRRGSCLFGGGALGRSPGFSCSALSRALSRRLFCRTLVRSCLFSRRLFCR